MPSDSPLISVVMPVYAANYQYLKESIESILSQSFDDFEFIIICDDPSDKTKEIINEYQASDKRINVIYQKREGLVASLNKGFSMARGEYIARMDADDISFSQRFEEQIKFLEANSDIGVCGTGIKITDRNVHENLVNPTDDASIKANLLFRTSIAHPTVMIRRNILKNLEILYDSRYKHAEDYELWVRCSEFTKFANLKNILLVYRLNDSRISKIFQKEQIEISYRIQLLVLKKFDYHFTNDQLNVHSSMILQEFEKCKTSIQKIESWLLTLLRINDKNHIYPEFVFNKILAEQWYLMCNSTTNLGLWNWKKFWKSPLSKYVSLNKAMKFKFFIACLVKFWVN
jgi:glycosyltransferase involved in cell wall biosynthesis